jgi:hypothetical protein
VHNGELKFLEMMTLRRDITCLIRAGEISGDPRLEAYGHRLSARFFFLTGNPRIASFHQLRALSLLKRCCGPHYAFALLEAVEFALAAADPLAARQRFQEFQQQFQVLVRWGKIAPARGMTDLITRFNQLLMNASE